ncbi:YkgJ family cysteine cluster protein [Polyangium spumosum]|uniref:YkgJ family cysteine cluster protein n=1 Tax=Polyangium spumosum TaxID=889282 RepID=A0A6N7PKI9_9BACT|nr:YkgJ family cysteine cluster protein [Polyangium spumosum]
MESAVAAGRTRVQYDCNKCVAFCCSIYERVEVTTKDVKRLAAHFGVTPEVAEKRFTVHRFGGRILRRKRDPFFGKACKFLHPETRGCTIYEGRPQACREYPGKSRCGYYEVLQFEREIQDDPTIVPIVRLTFKKQLLKAAR